MTPSQKRTLQFGEWVIDDLRMQTDKVVHPFSCYHTPDNHVPMPSPRTVAVATDAIDRTAALAAMYVRLVEQAENLGLLRIGESAQVRKWLTSGVLYR